MIRRPALRSALRLAGVAAPLVLGLGLAANPAVAADKPVAGKGLTITEAAIRGGSVVVSGKARRAGFTVSVGGTAIKARADKDGAIALKLDFLPPACRLTLKTPEGTLSVPVAGCTKKGARGEDGARGPAGLAGPAGVAGAAGDVGDQGPQGPAGPAGDQGIAGPAGPQGVQGFAGAKGPTGPAGPQGSAGIFSGQILFARVAADGRLLGGTPGVGVGARSNARYNITFPVDVSGCALMATDTNIAAPHTVLAIPAVNAINEGLLPTQVQVRTFTAIFTPGDFASPTVSQSSFDLIAYCTG